MACPQCGSENLIKVADLYLEEVRKPEADAALLESLAPPSRKAILYGTIFGFFLWIALLAPFFVPVEMMLRTALYSIALALPWLPVFIWALRGDRRRKAAYEARRCCPSCSWVEPA